jgi:hypothetical protein
MIIRMGPGTHAFNKKSTIQILVSTMYCFDSRKNFFRSYMRARKNKRPPGSTYNMPEKHQIFARPNKTLKIIGTAEAINRQHEPFLSPSFNSFPLH